MRSRDVGVQKLIHCGAVAARHRLFNSPLKRLAFLGGKKKRETKKQGLPLYLAVSGLRRRLCVVQHRHITLGVCVARKTTKLFLFHPTQSSEFISQAFSEFERVVVLGAQKDGSITGIKLLLQLLPLQNYSQRMGMLRDSCVCTRRRCASISFANR